MTDWIDDWVARLDDAQRNDNLRSWNQLQHERLIAKHDLQVFSQLSGEMERQVEELRQRLGATLGKIEYQRTDSSATVHFAGFTMEAKFVPRRGIVIESAAPAWEGQRRDVSFEADVSTGNVLMAINGKRVSATELVSTVLEEGARRAV